MLPFNFNNLFTPVFQSLPNELVIEFSKFQTMAIPSNISRGQLILVILGKPVSIVHYKPIEMTAGLE